MNEVSFDVCKMDQWIDGWTKLIGALTHCCFHLLQVKLEQLGAKKNMCLSVHIKDGKLTISKQDGSGGGQTFQHNQGKVVVICLFIPSLFFFLSDSTY